MKKILLAALMAIRILSDFSPCQAQVYIIDASIMTNQDSIDSRLISVQYEMSFITDTLAETPKPATETLMLEVGKRLSKCYSYNSYVCDSIIRADMQTGASQETINQHIMAMGTPRVSYQIFKHYPTGKVTTVDRIATTNILCEEIEEVPVWSLLPDTATFLSFHCQKAVCHFKGRNYTAWYTQEIPIPEGPWKLFGLPGLIIRAEDDRQQYAFMCTGIERCKTEQPILIHQKGRERVSRKELNELYERMAKDPIGFLASTAPYVKLNVKDKHGNPLLKFSIPYNPIELPE